jgi:glycosyltransferase involved in cell wall biosynthesis
MRILMLCTDPGIRLPGRKGASLHLQAVLKGLVKAGHDVRLVAVAGLPEDGAPGDGSRADLPGGPHLLLPHPGRADGLERETRRLRFVSQVPLIIAEQVADFRPDVVWERLSLFGTAGVEVSARFGVPHVVEVNALLAEEDAAWRGLRLARTAGSRERRVLESADAVYAVSEEVAAAVRGVARRPVFVLPNGFDSDLFVEPGPGARASARRCFGLPATEPVLAFVGALRPWHGVDVAIRALHFLPGSVFAVAGDGPVKGQLQALASDLGVTNQVRFVGALDHDEVAGFLAAADVALAPYPDSSEFAFSPLKVYEYLAAGVPVVASSIGQLVPVLSREAAVLVTPGDAASLAAGVQAVLSDPSIAARARADRSRVVAQHSWDERVERLDGILREVTGRDVAC